MRKLAALVAVASIVACDGRGMVGPTGVAGPNHAMVQAGNDHFFFLPPLVKSTQSPNGEFNPNLAPVVEVCRVTSSTCDLVARFSMTAGTHGETVTVNALEEHYKVNWNTGLYAIQAGVYRISVRTAASDVAHTLLGSQDIDVTSTGRSASDKPNIRKGQTLPIKFRIEYGALCSTDGCLETSVGIAGGTFTLEDSIAGADFPDGAIPASAGRVNLIIERFTDHTTACLPTNYPQYEGCYRFRTEPHVTFNELVTVGICLDPSAHAIEAQLELQKWDEVDPALLISLPRTTVDFLGCEDFQLSQGPSTLAGQLARAGGWLLSPLARMFTPDAAYAGVITPYGGKLSDFSRIGWVRPLQINALPAGASSSVGTALTPSPSVRVTSARTGALVEGVPIAWSVTLGGGSVSPAAGITGVDGVMSTTWVLGALPGANRAMATGSNPRPTWPGRPGVWGTTAFNATAIALPVYRAVFMTPIGTATTGSENAYIDLAPSVTVCALSAGACVEAVATLATDAPDLLVRVYQAKWNTPKTLPHGFYRVTVSVEGKAIGSIDIEADSKKKEGEGFQFEVGSTLPIKFSIEP